MFAELVQLLLEGRLDLLRLGHLGTNLTNRGVQPRPNHHAASFARGYVRAGEQDVLLVLCNQTDGIILTLNEKRSSSTIDAMVT